MRSIDRTERRRRPSSAITFTTTASSARAGETAAKSVRELRVAEVVRQDLTIQDGAVLNYRVRLGISFKYDPE